MPTYNYAAGPSKDYPAFMPTPEPLAMLFQGLGMGGNTANKKNKPDGGGEGYDKLAAETLPGDYKGYAIRRSYIDDTFKTRQAALINGAIKHNGDLPSYFTPEVLNEMKQIEMDKRASEIELESFVGIAKSNKQRYKEQQDKLSNLSLSDQLYDNKGRIGLTSPNGDVITTKYELDQYNENKDIDQPFLDYTQPDYDAFEKARREAFEGIGNDEIKETYKYINSHYSLDESGNLVPVKTTLETLDKDGGMGSLPTNMRQVYAAMNLWEERVLTDPKLNRVYRIKESQWDESNKSKKKPISYNEHLFGLTAESQINYKMIGGYIEDHSKDGTAGLQPGLLQMIQDNQIDPTKREGQQVVKKENGELTIAVLNNRQWNITDLAYIDQNNILYKNMQANNPTKVKDATDLGYVFVNGMPVSKNAFEDMNALLAKYTGIVVEYNKPNEIKDIDGNVIGVEPPVMTEKKVLVGLTYYDNMGHAVSSPTTQDQFIPSVSTDKVLSQRAMVFVPAGDNPYFAKSEGRKAIEDIPQYNYLFGTKGFDIDELETRTLTTEEAAKWGLQGETEYYVLEVDIPISNLSLYGSETDVRNSLEMQTTRNKMKKIRTDQLIDQAFDIATE